MHCRQTLWIGKSLTASARGNGHRGYIGTEQARGEGDLMSGTDGSHSSGVCTTMVDGASSLQRQYDCCYFNESSKKTKKEPISASRLNRMSAEALSANHQQSMGRDSRLRYQSQPSSEPTGKRV